MNNNLFQFKQFAINQSGCAMKVNTDGVLLAALAEAEDPKQILDIGTGTGLIALMLAQRYTQAHIDAVEIDEKAAQTAKENFSNSPFANQLTVHPTSFETYFEKHPQDKYDLIISNPPFFINSFKSNNQLKELAKHTNEQFFHRLISQSKNHLNDTGILTLILPLDTDEFVRKIAADEYQLYLQSQMPISSFLNSIPHRKIITLSFNPKIKVKKPFIIYDKPKIYSNMYKMLLKDFLTIF